MRLIGVNRPDTCRMVGRTGREVSDIGGEENASNVGLMGDKFAYWNERGDVFVLDHAPDVDVALITG